MFGIVSEWVNVLCVARPLMIGLRLLSSNFSKSLDTTGKNEIDLLVDAIRLFNFKIMFLYISCTKHKQS